MARRAECTHLESRCDPSGAARTKSQSPISLPAIYKGRKKLLNYLKKSPTLLGLAVAKSGLEVREGDIEGRFAVQVGNLDVPCLDRPHLGGHLRHELLVVGDHHHGALEGLDRGRQAPKRVPIQVVGRLVQDQDVWGLVHGRREDEACFLPPREGPNELECKRADEAESAEELACLLLARGAMEADKVLHGRPLEVGRELLYLVLGHVGDFQVGVPDARPRDRVQCAREELGERGLTRPVPPHDGRPPAGGHAARHPLQQRRHPRGAWAVRRFVAE
mmetsp:Transcript_21232/g.47911  ORF Transcript_21232/g.47911 Transcript_21232/m.47911 type:complete len:276 (+) Transcript_21232:94-921(+)